MRRFGQTWLYSPRDVLAVLECEHRLQLEHAAAQHLLPRAAGGPDATLELVKSHGLRHEHDALAALGRVAEVRTIDVPGHDDPALLDAAQATTDAMDAGVPVIYQAVLLVDGFLGYADFLVGVDLGTGKPLLEADGRQRYEPVDTKLARHAKPTALLQLACYADALVRLGRPVPRQVHLWLGDGSRQAVPAADVLPLAQEYRGRVLAQLTAEPAVPTPTWGDARPACGTCGWLEHCADGRRQARDLSLVAGMRRDQIHRLREQGVATVDALATAADGQRPPTMGTDTWTRLRAQAALQVAGAGALPPRHEVFDPAGLALLPAPDPGDLYYDIEGNPFAEDGAGLEYLHGLVDTSERFTAFWAHNRPQEKQAFEQLVDALTAAAAAHPGMHVYHYAPYERTALTTLAARHATREEQVDQLLRDGRLVDLYGVVRRAVRVSTESYSIKKLEPLYMGAQLRTGDVTNAGDSIVQYEQAVEHRRAGRHAAADELLESIRDYNEYDCVSTHRLHQWLQSLQATTTSAPLPPAEVVERETPETELLAERLRTGVPDADRTPEQQATALVAAALGYHRRNQKTFWWEHFDRLRRPLTELVDDDAVVVLECAEGSEWAKPTPRSNLARTVTADTVSTPEDVASLGQQPFVVYGSPLPEHLEPSADSDRATHTGAKDLTVAVGSVSFTERAPKGSEGWTQLPLALTPAAPPHTAALEAVLCGLGEHLLDDPAPRAAWFALLTACPPVTPLPRTKDNVADITAAVAALDHGVLAVQGPPGTGKTYVGSHVIAALAQRGWRIGVTAQGHKTVENLLERVVALGATVAKEVPASGPRGTETWQTPKKLVDWMAAQEGGYVVGGTAWTFARPAVREHPLDLVVVDEAGQFSLPDALVTGSAASRILLLGDPQQLPQVSQGQHPEPVDVSALGHVLGEHALIPATHGYLLDVTWRMRPEVCAPVSALQYEGALHSHEQCIRRTLAGVAPGVHLVDVDHHDNRTRSDEEVAAVVQLVSGLLGAEWTDVDAAPRPLDQSDVLVVAPFNRQVVALRRGLDHAGYPDVAVGTVDKFQGREAAVVIVSMTTSSGDDLPRGVEFLLNRNRLNVALSRAMHTAYLVHSPLLRRITPTSTDGLRALGAFLGVLHSAEAPPAAG
ncbi:TM0106 family RecB-like putative nuclease [Rhodococcus sp. X156]|uniref:TM0106 family RecB-like putative nuclease n=1 Tax=Rhodococcus sp. X156 TaxID=2499145 RepID=UPI000FD740A2|nr:TM0106 family RecB-like putative nuclease [Rhodococcus sp. X156]